MTASSMATTGRLGVVTSSMGVSSHLFWPAYRRSCCFGRPPPILCRCRHPPSILFSRPPPTGASQHSRAYGGRSRSSKHLDWGCHVAEPATIGMPVPEDLEAMDRLETMTSFVEVAKQGSFSIAANQLKLSRALVSRHIQ